MGRISAPFGIKGWVNIQADTESPDSLVDYPELHVGSDGQWRVIKVEEISVRPKGSAVKFFGVEDRDQAFALRGQLVAIPRSALPAAGKDEYYWADLIGLSVVGLEGAVLGTVSHLLETGSNDVLVVKGQDGVERLIPFVAAIVEKVDIAAKVITTQWGLDY